MYAYALNTALVRSWYGVGLAVRFVAAASASELPPDFSLRNAADTLATAPAGALAVVSFVGRERQRAARPILYVISCHTRQRFVFNSVQRSAHFSTSARFHVKHRT